MAKNFPVAGRIPPPRHPSLLLRVHVSTRFGSEVAFGRDDADALLKSDEGAPSMGAEDHRLVPRGARALGGHQEALAVQELLEHLDVGTGVMELEVSRKDEGNG